MLTVLVTRTDLQRLEAITSVTGDALRTISRNLAERARDEWIRAAQRELVTSRAAYVEAIQPIADDGRAVVVALKGSLLAQMVERGASSYQLQKTLLQGEKSRVIPFRFSGAGTRGTSAPVLGAAYGPGGGSRAPHVELDPVVLGRKIQRAINKLPKGHSLRPHLAPKLRPHHNADLFAGLRREGAARHGQYRTYRTISAEGGPNKWLHPGIQAKNLRRKAQAHLHEISKNAVREYLRTALRS